MNDVYFAWIILGCAFIFIPPLFIADPGYRGISYFEGLCGWLFLVVFVAAVGGVVCSVGWAVEVLLS